MRLMVMVLVGAASCGHSAPTGCDKDTDCKGDRVCQQRVCVDKPTKPSPPKMLNVDRALLTAKKYASEAYPLWQTAHPGKSCPEKLDELNEWADAKNDKDPWGIPYRMFCGADVPPGVKGGFGVLSAGENMKFGDADDIKSWEP